MQVDAVGTVFELGQVEQVALVDKDEVLDVALQGGQFLALVALGVVEGEDGLVSLFVGGGDGQVDRRGAPPHAGYLAELGLVDCCLVWACLC